MKRFQLAILATIALTACEDGPTQTFNPAPGGADGRWNDGNNAGVADPATQGFNQDVGGNTKQEICTAPQKKAKWASAFASPIQPPRHGGGLDLAGSDKWEGLTVEQAEQTNCQSANDSVSGNVAYNYWGDNGELYFWYRLSNRKIGGLFMLPGYTGTLDFTSRDGQTNYRIALSGQIKKGAKGGTLNPMVLAWDPADTTNGPGVWANDITDALFATFMPGLPAETNCLQNAHCIIESFGDAGGLFIPALGLGFDVASVTAAQPTPSTINQLETDLAKVLPFSQANPLLKLDAVGPIATVSGLGPSKKTCSLKIGTTYSDFLGNCVRTSGNSANDDQEQNKLLGGLAHGDERFHFDLTGVDINMTSKSLAPDNVIRDNDLPQPNDVSTRFTVDQSTLGKILNDQTGNDVSQPADYHGTGLIYAEFIRLVQQEIYKAYPAGQAPPMHALGAAECLPASGKIADMAAGCTGFEGFVVPLAPSKISDPNLAKLAVDPNSDAAADIVGAGGMKPGHQNVTICSGPGQTHCRSGNTFPLMYARILAVLGKNNAGSLPPSIQDGRFFFQQWAKALFKYFLVEDGTGTATHAMVQNAPFDANNLFFDSIGAGQFETAEYVDRRFVDATHDPFDISVTVDVKNGIFNDYDFSRDLLRGETAIYNAIRSTPTEPVGLKPALLSNVFGSPVIKGGWHDHDGATAYQCATGTAPDMTACAGEKPPIDIGTGLPLLDDNGNPLLTAYKDAFSTAGIFRLGGAAKVDVTQTYPGIQQAMTSYQLTKAGAPQNFLVPWLPKQPGVGFPIAVSGTIDKFVSTSQLDFTGTTISATVDYDLQDPTRPDASGYTFLAVESSDFLGELFMCASGGDVLHVRMYTPAANILDWLANHPGSTTSCGIVVRYSPYNNFPDYISSLTNGIRLGITQGGGFGRVVDSILFVPGQ